MTIQVSENSPDVLTGVDKMITAAIDDYKSFMPLKNGMDSVQIGVRQKMCDEFTTNWKISNGNKYVKIMVKNGGSVWGFVVNTDNDKKFKKGDILKAASFAAPARNAARGNVLDGDYDINWTGPLYL